MEYGIDYILKLPTEDIKTYLESASIIDILAILENIKKRKEMDYASLNKLEKLEEQIKINKNYLTDIDKRINFATKTNAPKVEVDLLWEEYSRYDAIIDDLTSKKEQLIQEFNDKKQAIFTLAWNMILEAPVSKLEDYRNSLITWLKNRIEAIETNKSNREITTNTLLEDRNFTKEDLTVKSIDAEIKEMESQVLNHELILNEETIGKIKSLRAKKESLEHETFTFVCTEKIKTSLKTISNDITKLQMELFNIIQMDIESLKEMILSDYAQGKEEIKLANYVRIYRSYLENISKVPLTLKAAYRNICLNYANLLNSIENPSFEGETLNDLDIKLKELHNYIKTLEQYKTKKNDKTTETKFLYTTVRQQGLFELPFSKDKWLSYFGKYFESLLNEIKPLEEKNKEYISLTAVSLKSKKIEEELDLYRKDLRSMLDELYNKVLSIYLKNNLYINVNVYDYRDTETFTKYLEYQTISIDKEIASVKTTIEGLNRKKSNILELINDTYSKIDTDIKAKLNSIFNGTYVKEEEQEEKPHHFFASPTTLEPSYNDTFDDTTSNLEPISKVEEEPEVSEFDSFFATDIPFKDDDIEENNELPEEAPTRPKHELEPDEVPLKEKEIKDEQSNNSSITTFNPDDIFGSTSNTLDNALEEEQKKEPVVSKEDDDTVISFDSEDTASTKASEKKEEASAVSDDINFDDAISSSDREAFKELLEPQKVPDFNTIINTPEPSTKEETTKIKKRGLKVIKQEPVVSKKMPKKTPEVVSKTPVKTDATEIKERIENSQNDRQSKNVPPLFNPASASDVKSEYNDTNAPIDLNAFLNGNLSNPTEKQETKEVDDKTKKLTLSQDDNINLMDFLNQIENNDAKVA